MGDTETPRRRFFYAEFEEDIHREICKMATRWGIEPVELLQRYAIEGLEKDSKTVIEELGWESQAFLAAREIRGRERGLQNLRQLAFRWLKDQREDDYDKLESLCELAGVDPEYILAQVRDVGTEPIAYNNTRGIKAAADWLQKTMRAGESYAVNDIMALAAALDFTDAVVNAAKRYAGIVSKRIGNKWYWYIPG